MYLKRIILTTAILSLLFVNCSKEEENPNNSEGFIESAVILETETAKIHGTLSASAQHEKTPLVIIIAGSGPTDRNGNSTSGLFTDTYKMISDTLAQHSIACLRYDKRGVAQSYFAGFNEEDLRFDDYVDDVVQWIDKMQKEDRFSRIFILGHSEGSLIGMLALRKSNVSGFISVAGTAQSADAIILEQLANQSQEILTEAETIIGSLLQGILVPEVSQALYGLFRPAIQPYLISWFAYNPSLEITNITIPSIIIHGTTDL